MNTFTKFNLLGRVLSLGFNNNFKTFRKPSRPFSYLNDEIVFCVSFLGLFFFLTKK